MIAKIQVTMIGSSHLVLLQKWEKFIYLPLMNLETIQFLNQKVILCMNGNAFDYMYLSTYFSWNVSWLPVVEGESFDF